jgi:hypothetical protein
VLVWMPWKDSAGAHGHESMNFFLEEYDVGASIPKVLEEEKSTTNANFEEIKILKDVASLKVLMWV